MKDFTYSAQPTVLGWNWELHHPKENGEIGTCNTGWSFTINGAMRRMKRLASEHEMKKHPPVRGTL